MVVGAALVMLVPARERPTGPEAVRGHRVFRVSARAAEGMGVTLGERRFAARRTPSGWQIDGQAADVATTEALADLLDALVALRAVDVFRPRDGSTFGLSAPRATIEILTARGPRRLVIGDPNSAGSAFYARRPGDPRVMQVGAGILSGLERVFYHRGRESRGG